MTCVNMANYIAIAMAAGAVPAQGRLAQRSHNKDRAPLYSTEDIRQAARLCERDVSLLNREYHAWRQIKFAINPMIDRSEVRMQAFLIYLARGGFFHQVARAEGIAKSTLMLHVKEVAQYFAETAANYIALPTAAQLNGMSLSLQDQQTPQVRFGEI
jgi:hypothetical protein